jgi:CheY-like chemotaxis protein
MVKSNLPVNGTRPCVLIIDDEEAVRGTLRTILQSDYDILEADSAERGLEMLKKDHADLITMDVRMPGRSGMEALRQLRQTEEYENTPVIMITGHASLDGACEALRLGATDYIQKPFAVDQLKLSIRNSLKRHETVRLPLIAHRPGMGEVNDGSQANLARLGKASAAFVHDLASPLQILTILNSLCLRKIASTPPSRERDKELSDAMGQMERLLAWSAELMKGWQTIAVPTQFCKESLDVDESLDRVMEIIRPYAKMNEVTLTRKSLPHKMLVHGDRIQLERALVNISLNGIKASTSRARTMELGAIPFGNYCVFRLVDSGQGFTYERMKEVLGTDPFGAPGKARRGLGLFIADWIAVNHGGKLQFICEKGIGTTVEIFVPSKPA